MSRQVTVIPHAQRYRAALPAFPFDFQARGACQEQHPFVFILVIPVIWRRALAGGDDSLNAHAIRANEVFHELVREGIWEIGKQVFRRHLEIARQLAVKLQQIAL